MSCSDDIQCWDEFRKGKEKSLFRLYEKYHGDLLRYGLSFISDLEIVREYINRVFLDLWNKRATLPEVEHPKAYIVACYKNKLFYRKKGKGALNLVYVEPNQIAGGISEQSYEEVIIELQEFEQLKIRLKRALNFLTERQQTILTKRYLDEMTFEAIAEELHVSVRTIYNSIHESLKQLRNDAQERGNTNQQSG
ncbi:MAG: sigma-70 family RNA polymerase sigma factor [Agriterribacter sp.]